MNAHCHKRVNIRKVDSCASNSVFSFDLGSVKVSSFGIGFQSKAGSFRLMKKGFLVSVAQRLRQGHCMGLTIRNAEKEKGKFRDFQFSS